MWDLYAPFVLPIYLYNTYSQKKKIDGLFLKRQLDVYTVHGILFQHATRCFILFVIKLNRYIYYIGISQNIVHIGSFQTPNTYILFLLKQFYWNFG